MKPGSCDCLLVDRDDKDEGSGSSFDTTLKIILYYFMGFSNPVT